MKRRITLLAVAGVALTIWSAGCARQTTSTIGLTPELQEITALAQNRTSDENIIGYIRNSGKTYKLTANDIVLLSKNGVSQNVIAALMQPPLPAVTAPVVTAEPVPTAAATVAPAPAPVPPTPVIVNVNNTAATPAAPVAAVAPSVVSMLAPLPPEPPASPEYFEGQLAPYGEWLYLPEFGTRCWLPAGLPPGWRPYFDAGHWVYTDSGMYWQSEHPWGAVPFHYGRWVFRGRWLWVPAYEYAPAWVVWRHSEGQMGWAPVPPGAMFVGGGWEYHGRRVAVDFDFGLSPTLFVFVGGGHFLDRDFHRHELRGEEWHRVYGRSQINHCVRDERGHGFRVEGFERNHVEVIVGRKVEPVHHEEVRGHALDNLRKNSTPQPKSGPTPKVNPPAASSAPVSRMRPVPPAATPDSPKLAPLQPAETTAREELPKTAPAQPAAPSGTAKVRPHVEPKPVAESTPKVTPVQPVEAPAREVFPKPTASQPATPVVTPTLRPHAEPKPQMDAIPKVTTVQPTEAPPREIPTKRTVTQPPAEVREPVAPIRSEPVSRNPVREERSVRTSGRPSAVDSPATQDTYGKTPPADSKRKRKDSDQLPADPN